MSWLANLMPGGTPAAQPQPAAQSQQPAQQGSETPASNGNPPLPNNQGGQGNNSGTINQNEGSNTQTVDPMDAYSKLWDNATKTTEAPPSFSLDSKTLDTVASSMRFSQDMPPELTQRIASGDMTALAEMMDHVGRKAYQASMQHSSALTDKFVGMREEHFNSKGLPARMREELTMNALDGSGKIHPATKKQLADIARRIQAQHPDASPQDIAKQAREYVNDLYTSMNPDAQKTQATTGAPEPTNWDKYFDGE